MTISSSYFNIKYNHILSCIITQNIIYFGKRFVVSRAYIVTYCMTLRDRIQVPIRTLYYKRIRLYNTNIMQV